MKTDGLRDLFHHMTSEANYFLDMAIMHKEPIYNETGKLLIIYSEELLKEIERLEGKTHEPN
jgi:hypothetical protein